MTARPSTISSNPWLVLAIISGALLLIGIDMTVLNVALPRLSQELGATNSDKLWMVNAYSLIMAGLLPGFGTLADKIGHRTMLLAGLAVFGLASLFAAFAPTPAILIVARGVLAIGAAMMMPATLSIVRLVFTQDQQRATAIGIWGAVWSGAAALGPVLGGFLLEHFWWGSVFLINVPIVIVTFFLALKKIPHLPGNPHRHWDILTSALLTVSLIGLLYALKGLLKTDIHGNEVAIATVVGLAFGWLFLRRQKAQPSPLVDFSLFRNSRFSVGAIVALAAGFAFMGLQFVLSQELQLVRGMSPLMAGLFVLPIAIASFVGGPIVGRFMLQVGIERMMAITLGIGTLGMGLYTVTGHMAPMLWEFVTLALIGIGAGGSMAVASTAIMISAPEDRAGMAGSIESVSYELGGTLGVAVMGSIVAAVYSQTFAPSAAVQLSASAWDSLDQAMVAVGALPAGQASSVIEAGKGAFLNGANATFVLATVVMFVLFVGATLYARGKKPQAFAVSH